MWEVKGGLGAWVRGAPEGEEWRLMLRFPARPGEEKCCGGFIGQPSLPFLSFKLAEGSV